MDTAKVNSASTPPKALPAPRGEPSAARPEAQEMTRIEVPLEIPREMLQPDASGKMPIDDYQVQLLPKDAIITNQTEVRKLVEQVREETLPQGMKVELADSPAGLKVARGKQVLAQLAQMGGGLGVYTLTGVGGTLGALAFVPASVAAPLATVGGAVGLLTGADQIKAGLDARHYYESLKARGVDSIPIQQPVRQPDGSPGVAVKEIPIDDIISGARDSAIVGALTTASSAAMLAAGLGAPPLVAVASIALSVGTALFASRKILVALARKLGGWIRSRFSGRDQSSKAGQAPATSAGQSAAAEPLTGDQQKAAELVTRIQQLQGRLMADPRTAARLMEAQQLQQKILADPQGNHDPARQRLEKIDQELRSDPETAGILQELQKLQQELARNPAFQREVANAFGQAARPGKA